MSTIARDSGAGEYWKGLAASLMAQSTVISSGSV
jgi:hypothetical protein